MKREKHYQLQLESIEYNSSVIINATSTHATSQLYLENKISFIIDQPVTFRCYDSGQVHCNLIMDSEEIIIPIDLYDTKILKAGQAPLQGRSGILYFRHLGTQEKIISLKEINEGKISIKKEENKETKLIRIIQEKDELITALERKLKEIQFTGKEMFHLNVKVNSGGQEMRKENEQLKLILEEQTQRIKELQTYVRNFDRERISLQKQISISKRNTLKDSFVAHPILQLDKLRNSMGLRDSSKVPLKAGTTSSAVHQPANVPSVPRPSAVHLPVNASSLPHPSVNASSIPHPLSLHQSIQTPLSSHEFVPAIPRSTSKKFIHPDLPNTPLKLPEMEAQLNPNLQDWIEQIQSKLESKEEDLMHMEREIEKYKSIVARRDLQIKKLKGKNQPTDQINELQLANQQREKLEIRLETEINDNLRRKKNNEMELKEMKSKASKLERTCTIITETNATLQVEVASLKQQKQLISSAKMAVETELGVINEKLRELGGRLAISERQKAQMEINLKRETETSNVKSLEYESLKKKAKRLQEVNAKLQASYGELYRFCLKIESAVNKPQSDGNIGAKMDELKKRLKEVEEVSLRKQIADLQDEKESAQRQSNNATAQAIQNIQRKMQQAEQQMQQPIDLRNSFILKDNSRGDHSKGEKEDYSKEEKPKGDEVLVSASKIQEYQQKIQMLEQRDKVKESRDKVKESRDKVKESRDKVKESRDKVKESREKNNPTERSIVLTKYEEQKQSIIGEMLSNREVFQKSFQEVKNENRQLGRAKNELQKQNRRLITQGELLARRLQQQQKMKEKASQQLEESSLKIVASQEEKNRLQSQCGEYERIVARLEEELKESVRLIDTNSKECRELMEIKGRLTTRLGQYEKEEQSILQEMQALKNTVTSNQNRMVQLIQERNSLFLKLEKLKGRETDRLNGIIIDLQAKLETQICDALTLKALLQDSKNSNHTLQEQLQASLRNNTVLEERHCQEVKQLLLKIGDTENNVDELHSALLQLGEEVQQKHTQLQEYSLRLETEESKATVYTEKINEMKELLEERQREAQQLKTEAKKYAQSMLQYERQYEIIKAEIGYMNGEMERLRATNQRGTEVTEKYRVIYEEKQYQIIELKKQCALHEVELVRLSHLSQQKDEQINTLTQKVNRKEEQAKQPKSKLLKKSSFGGGLLRNTSMGVDDRGQIDLEKSMTDKSERDIDVYPLSVTQQLSLTGQQNKRIVRQSSINNFILEQRPQQRSVKHESPKHGAPKHELSSNEPPSNEPPQNEPPKSEPPKSEPLLQESRRQTLPRRQEVQIPIQNGVNWDEEYIQLNVHDEYGPDLANSERYFIKTEKQQTPSPQQIQSRKEWENAKEGKRIEEGDEEDQFDVQELLAEIAFLKNQIAKNDRTAQAIIEEAMQATDALKKSSLIVPIKLEQLRSTTQLRGKEPSPLGYQSMKSSHRERVSENSQMESIRNCIQSLKEQLQLALTCIMEQDARQQELQSDLQSREQQYGRLLDISEEYQRTLQHNADKLLESQAQVVSLQEKTQGQETLLMQASERSKSLAERLEAITTDLMQKESHLAELIGEHIHIKSEENEWASRVREMEMRKGERDTEWRNQCEAMNKMKRDYRKYEEQSQLRMLKCKQDKEAAQRKLQEIKHELRLLGEEYILLEQAHLEVRNQLITEREQAQQKQVNYQQYMSRLTVANQEIHKLERSAVEYQGKIRELERQRLIKQEQIDYLKKEAIMGIKKQQIKINSADQSAKQLEGKLTESKKVVSALKREIALYNDECNQLRRINQQMVADCGKIEKELKEILQSGETEVKQWATRCKELQSQIEKNKVDRIRSQEEKAMMTMQQEAVLRDKNMLLKRVRELEEQYGNEKTHLLSQIDKCANLLQYLSSEKEESERRAAEEREEARAERENERERQKAKGDKFKEILMKYQGQMEQLQVELDSLAQRPSLQAYEQIYTLYLQAMREQDRERAGEAQQEEIFEEYQKYKKVKNEETEELLLESQQLRKQMNKMHALHQQELLRMQDQLALLEQRNEQLEQQCDDLKDDLRTKITRKTSPRQFND